jgi:hypothetical protein
MKKLGFACVCIASLALAACGRDDADTLDEGQADVGGGALNAQADNAAADAAAEMEALGSQEQQMQAENAAAAAVAETRNEADPDTPTQPSEVEDDVPGM